MKKLVLLMFFMIGLFSMSNAQVLNYSISNNSATSVWDYKMADAGSGVITSELGMIPGDVRTGTVLGFAFDLGFKARNNAGCGTGQTVTGPTPTVFVPLICSIPAGVSYSLTNTIPFVFQLDVILF